MHLVIDATVAKPPYSGVQLAAMNEARAMAALEPEATLLGTAPGFTPQPFWARRTAGRILWQQTLLPMQLRRLRADALLALAYTCPLHAPCPVILQVHDVIALDHPDLCSTLNALHIRTLLPGSIRRANQILASTHYVAERICAHFPQAEAKLRVVPLGVHYDFFATPSPRPSDLPEGPYFFFVGNLEPKKGLATLLQAFRSLASRCEANLVIAGRIAWKSTPILREIEQLKQDYPHRLITLGRVEAHELPGLYQHAAALVFPSTEEGFGLPILEAMAAGTPVIHSRQPALMETAAGYGLACSIGNASELADAMLHCLEQTDPAMLAQAKLHALSHSWSRWAQQVRKLLLYS